MQTIERAGDAYSFTGQRIGKTLAAALAFIHALGADEGDLIEVRGSGRARQAGSLGTLAALTDRLPHFGVDRSA